MNIWALVHYSTFRAAGSLSEKARTISSYSKYYYTLHSIIQLLRKTSQSNRRYLLDFLQKGNNLCLILIDKTERPCYRFLTHFTVRHIDIRGHLPQRGLLIRQVVAARSRIAQFISFASWHFTTFKASSCKYGS